MEKIKKPDTYVTSWRDLQAVVGCGNPEGWGKLLKTPYKKDHYGLSYQLSEAIKTMRHER